MALLVKDALETVKRLEAEKQLLNTRLQATFGEKQHCQQYTFHLLGYFFEHGQMKFFVQNKDGHKVVLYFSDLQNLIAGLKKLKSQAENTILQQEGAKKDG